MGSFISTPENIPKKMVSQYIGNTHNIKNNNISKPIFSICKYCKKEFNSKNKLKKHIKEMEKNKETRYHSLKYFIKNHINMQKAYQINYEDDILLLDCYTIDEKIKILRKRIFKIIENINTIFFFYMIDDDSDNYYREIFDEKYNKIYNETKNLFELSNNINYIYDTIINSVEDYHHYTLLKISYESDLWYMGIFQDTYDYLLKNLKKIVIKL